MAARSLFIAVACLLLSVGTARANFATQCFGAAPADLIAVQIDPASPHLAHPALAPYTDDCPPPSGTGATPAAGWHEVYNDGIIAIAVGPSTPLVRSLVTLLGSIAPYFEAFVAFDGDVLTSTANACELCADVDFPSWVTAPPTRAELDALVSRTPEPASLALLALGLAAIAFFRRVS